MITQAEIARKIVQNCLKVKPDEQVQISTYQHTLQMAEALAIECYKAGALPYILLDTDTLFRAILGEIPHAYLSKTPHYLLAASQRLDTIINTGGPEDPDVFSAGSPEKMTLLNQGFKPVADAWRQRMVREVSMDWGACTPQRARQYGVDFAAWQDSLQAAMSADYLAMADQGKRIAEILSNGEKVHLTAGGQTDILVRLAERPVFVNDGILDEADLARGQRWTSFPTGTVSIAPDEDSANGTIVFPEVQLWGKIVKDLRWNFKAGRLIDWSAAENGDLFAESYTSASGDKDRFGFLAIGINPLARPVGFFYNDWLVAGAVTGGIGSNQDDGGKNDTMFAQYACVRDASLEVDGKPVVKDGKLVM